jgi:hypothetical protein
MIKKAVGYQTDDGKMFSNLDEAAGHTYGLKIKQAIGTRGSGVFGVATILEHSREIEAILRDYNAELDRMEAEFKDAAS